jgi:hypothetical protein
VAFGEDPACLTEGGYAAGDISKFMKSCGEAQEISIERFVSPLSSCGG